MKLTRQSLRKLIIETLQEGIGFGQDPLAPTGKIIVIKRSDPRYTAYVGYEIQGKIRNLLDANSIDETRKVSLDFGELMPPLTHHYVLVGNTEFDADLQKFGDRGAERDIYDRQLGMMLKPWMEANNGENEQRFIRDLVNTKLKELGYFPMNDETFDNIAIQYLEQPVSLDKTKAKHPETGEDVYAAMDSPGDPEGLRKIGYQSDFD
jgi:hypothetical protein